MSEQHIFLVGPMGVGKTSVGRQLASLLHRPFVDVDAEIESRCGADIQWIFDMEGEAGFRKRETKVLDDIVANSASSVIATGGGVVMTKENRKILQSNGQVIYLSVSKEQLYERMRRDKSRPLLQVENREQVIDDLIELRDPLYREIADVVFAAEAG
jgi:shikimate kinase